MKYTRTVQAAAIASVAAMALAACGGGSGNDAEAVASASLNADTKVEISFAGWSLKSTPEFQTLVDAFNKEHPNVTVNIHEYSADDYDTQLTTDLSGGTAPEVFPIKNLQKYYSYAIDSNGGLADLTSVADAYKSDKNIDISQYNIDGKYYALPYRQDSWVLFYNKTMFEKAGVAIPDGTWTWDDYMKAAEELKQKLPAAGYDANSVFPTYHHNWQSVFQSFTTGQSAATVDGAKKNFLSGDYSYMKDMYNNVFLKAQDEGLTVDYNTSTSNKVQYQAQFGTEKAAMLPMGTWYAATLVSQQKSGDANKFEWGMAPIPQSSTVKSDDGKPITFADPTGLAISGAATGDKLAAAKEFVQWASGEGGAKALAAIATTPAYFSDSVVSTYFGVDGMANDDQSKKAWQEHDTRPENYVDKKTNDIQAALKIMNSTIMTKTGSVDDAIAKANADIAALK
ncbi:ABC transporter, solute-binding protein [Bifidobacterium sp. DSM 109958]|uniref:ABC transporter, solute-binding protein n=1 Tax=Bifidobacterium moraviense TaxID=2675323 RepID=A0A7Y0HXE7_9BIFI|nr:extracellular solute-binding protein [Bifidobacterium sp. DSM 109958]NMN00186.1 ABC transporter, solute-binding protein [Bifidobacterium sp. DSM 109958]